ncbi:MAG: hypothetical protein N3F64_05110 [Nitrososphaeria archaeon]|nr:hypothetical protein [Nitrososphaeria archaeon]
MIGDTIEVLKTLSVFIVDTRKCMLEKRFPEKFSPLLEDLNLKLQGAAKSVEKIFDAINKFYNINSLDSLQKASSAFEILKFEDEIISMLNFLSSAKIRLQIILNEVVKEPLEKVDILERITVIDDVLKYFSKEKLSEQISLQVKAALENILSDTSLEDIDVQKIIEQSTKIKPDFSYRIRFVSEYPHLSSLILKVSKN